ncbi:MAG: phage holin family protein [Alphaproteobacteria bacterium]|nr:phage holin family protein [Alphaproteobacteria bacterium]
MTTQDTRDEEFQDHRYSSPPPRRRNRASASALISAILTDASRLLNTEFKLARREIANNVSDAVSGIAAAIGGLVLLGAGLVIVLQAIVAALVNSGMSMGWASLVTGGIVCLVGAALVYGGGSQLSSQSLAPTRTMKQSREDREMVREKMR